jgi:diguanylate cyclase (GGDEF)-like protein
MPGGEKPVEAGHRARSSGWVAFRLSTIRVQILLAFLAMSVITGALGVYAGQGIRRAGILVEETFDKSLMSVNYARAAAADFASMQAALTRWLSLEDSPERQTLETKIRELGSSLSEDLAIAAERSQSPRAARAAASAAAAVTAWQSAHKHLLAAPSRVELWTVLDHSVDAANHAIELLINYTAGDGFLYRQRAKKMVAVDRELTLAATASAVLLSALVVWLLARRITRPVAAASAAAARIASGDLSGAIPRGGADELGALLAAMGIMRDNIRAMMDREVAQRRSAEARLADALQSSGEGFVLLDQAGDVVMANNCARKFLGDIVVGQKASELAALLGPAGEQREIRTEARWLHLSTSATRDGGAVVVCTDITALKDNEAQLQSSLAWLDAALGNIAQGLCLYDAESRLQVVNARFCEIFRLPPDQIRPGIHLREVLSMSVEAGNHADRNVTDLLEAEGAASRPAPHDGAELMELSGGQMIAISRQTLADGGWVATYEDVTERRLAEAKIVYMARHDALTSLPNRDLLVERVEQAIAQAARDGHYCSVLFIDLDRFKAVNDTLGHPVGDELLRAVAERLEACVREVDTVARLGGDEFAVVQTGLERPEDAAILARRIVETLARPYDIDEHRVNVSTSVGISVAPIDGAYCGKLLKNADMALYKAKADGRATWRFFEPEMDASLQRKRGLEADLRDALTEEAMELHYQPLFDLKQGRVGGFEALLRWPHTRRGMVPPSEFIPLAEELGLIVPLGEWVLRQACAEAVAWPAHVKVAVNVSAAQFASGRLLQSVTDGLTASGLPASRLELEITESVLLSDGSATLSTLHALRSLGVRISMDDFGTGYSSLSYLRSFPFDKIKIDQSFVRDLKATEDADAIVRTMIVLGGSLRMRVTAEGVETAEQLAWLRSEGCTEAQGYFFSRPAPAAEIPRLLGLRFPDALAA